MLERFTDEARRVLVLAQEEVRTLYHNHIGTEHILLCVIHEGESAAATALEPLGVVRTAGRPPRRSLRRHPRSAEAGVDEWAESGEWLEPWPIEHQDDSAWEALAAARRVATDRAARETAFRDVLVGVAAVAGPGGSHPATGTAHGLLRLLIAIAAHGDDPPAG